MTAAMGCGLSYVGDMSMTSKPVPDNRFDSAIIDEFVAEHFSFVGSLRLHLNAIGLDLLRAPANVALSPIYVVLRLLSLLVSFAGFRHLGRWLARRRLLFRSDVTRALETKLNDDLISRILPDGVSSKDFDPVPVQDYLDVRGAVAEICTSALVLLIGIVLFGMTTPGVLSLAPVLSDYTLHASAVSDFPLGEGAGALWYGIFPLELPVWYLSLVGLGLVLAASLITAFIGVLADPLQSVSGIHKRRLLRLLKDIEPASSKTPGLAREHVLARSADIADGIIAVLRSLRP